MSPRGERAGRGGAGRERAGAEPRSPHRDRSSSASRSVRFRVEIGSRRWPGASWASLHLGQRSFHTPSALRTARLAPRNRGITPIPATFETAGRLKSAWDDRLPRPESVIKLADSGPAEAAGMPPRTDLGAELNRSRCGTEPISTKGGGGGSGAAGPSPAQTAPESRSQAPGHTEAARLGWERLLQPCLRKDPT